MNNDNLLKYNGIPTSDEMNSELDIIRNNARKLHQTETLIQLFRCLDLTTLQSTDTYSGVAAWVQKLNQFQIDYPHIGAVGAICVYPNLVSTVKENLVNKNVGIAAVSGGFPASQTFKQVKVVEALLTIEKGATELDIVIPLWAFLDGNMKEVFDEVAATKATAGNVPVKVILETGALSTIENIWKASLISMEAGADFIKTSTGKMQPAATLESAYIMTKAIQSFYQVTGRKVGFKPAGGIQTTSVALEYLAVVLHNLGLEWFHNHLFRIGASSLANHLFNEIMMLENPNHEPIPVF